MPVDVSSLLLITRLLGLPSYEPSKLCGGAKQASTSLSLTAYLVSTPTSRTRGNITDKAKEAKHRNLLRGILSQTVLCPVVRTEVTANTAGARVALNLAVCGGTRAATVTVQNILFITVVLA